MRGDAEGLCIQPQLPSAWDSIKVTRLFRGATFKLDIRRSNDVKEVRVMQGEKVLPEARITNIQAGQTYELSVLVPQ